MHLSKIVLLFLKIFVIFVFFVALSEQQMVRDFSKDVSYANFLRNENQKLNTPALETSSVQNHHDCCGKCLINNNCNSVNYGKNELNQYKVHECQLLAANKFTSAQQMTVDNTFEHFSVVVSEF